MSLPFTPPALMRWLELKIPPLLWWLICVGLMWLLAQFWPLYHFSPTSTAWRIALATRFYPDSTGYWPGCGLALSPGSDYCSSYATATQHQFGARWHLPL